MDRLIVAVQFSDTINLGAVLLLVAGLALALIFTVRARASATWKDNYEAAEARLNRYEVELKEEREKKHEALSTLAALELTRDLTPVLRAMQDLVAKVVAMQEEGEARYGLALKDVRGMFAEHEQRAQDRHEAQLRVLDRIAEKINGGGS